MNEDALGWIIRQREPAFDDWEAFEAWLSADPAHAEAYQAMAVADQEMEGLFEALPPAAPQWAPLLDPVERPVRRRALMRGAWGAMAASVLAVTGYMALAPASSAYAVETAAGQHRSIALADGSHVDLNGATRIVLDRENPRIATLERGEALFRVRHDDGDPFRVTAGDAELVDIGTVFNVVRTPSALEVAVAEGAVIYNPDGEAVTLAAGRTLRADAREVRVATAEPSTIGTWRTGRLVYDGAPLGIVAADLSRNLGLSVSASPEVAARPFRGVIALGTDRQRLAADLESLLDVDVTPSERGWTLTPRARAEP